MIDINIKTIIFNLDAIITNSLNLIEVVLDFSWKNYELVCQI